MADFTLTKEVIVVCGIAGLLSKKGENVIPLLRGCWKVLSIVAQMELG
jgi:hypothetical protein